MSFSYDEYRTFIQSLIDATRDVGDTLSQLLPAFRQDYADITRGMEKAKDNINADQFNLARFELRSLSESINRIKSYEGRDALVKSTIASFAKTISAITQNGIDTITSIRGKQCQYSTLSDTPYKFHECLRYTPAGLNDILDVSSHTARALRECYEFLQFGTKRDGPIRDKSPGVKDVHPEHAMGKCIYCSLALPHCIDAAYDWDICCCSDDCVASHMPHELIQIPEIFHLEPADVAIINHFKFAQWIDEVEEDDFQVDLITPTDDDKVFPYPTMTRLVLNRLLTKREALSPVVSEPQEEVLPEGHIAIDKSYLQCIAGPVDYWTRFDKTPILIMDDSHCKSTVEHLIPILEEDTDVSEGSPPILSDVEEELRLIEEEPIVLFNPEDEIDAAFGCNLL